MGKHMPYIVAALLAGSLFFGSARAEVPLPKLNLDLSQTTVSGISSGAFMAVQFGVAHSATVRGVAATAGGPYFCAGQASWAGFGVSKAIARCMQGDPAYPAQPITEEDQDVMSAATRAWAAKGLIDGVENLARQQVWLFHGYNDGVVKKPVSDALQRYYAHFQSASRLFYKHELAAAHAQISASCEEREPTHCNTCSTTGGNFINTCTDSKAGRHVYDAAGSALQLFYGPLERTPSYKLQGQVTSFDQRPYVQKGGEVVNPIKVSLAETGYLYVPSDCRDGQTCRLHVAFHGCQQQAEKIGMDFVKGAGFNEWADANRIVVLYPQTAATVAVPITPFNPQGCWDWWGYNDFAFDMTGRYATKEGLQISAIWRMVQGLAGQGSGTVPPMLIGGTPRISVVDASSDRIALTWTPVVGAGTYRVYRGGVLGGEEAWLPVSAKLTDNSFVDSRLVSATDYRYMVRAMDAEGKDISDAIILARTASIAPTCDPYFSLAQGTPVTRDNRPTSKVCP